MQSITNLQQKNILLGISGSVAAEKSMQLAKLLQIAGASVKIICTENAKHFLSEFVVDFEIYSEVFTEKLRQMDHIELAKWADILLIAPASASILSRCANAAASDLLSLTYLATVADVYFAPAMNQQMWQQFSVQNVVSLLQQAGNIILGPAFGEQACGDIGYGRMLEPIDIVTQLEEYYQLSARGLNVLITAGPTQEPLDPVRYLTNRSSGKMGYALAAAFSRHGANVTLISGPTQQTPPKVAEYVAVESADQMQQCVLENIEQQNVMVAAAAVADYRPCSVETQKIKKTTERMTIKLVKNPDILKTAKQKNPHLFSVGFALETEDVIKNARSKLESKQCDMIVANHLSKTNPVFGSDYNKIYIVDANQQYHLPYQTKLKLADDIVKSICQKLS